jgi:cold shock CspA family protein
MRLGEVTQFSTRGFGFILERTTRKSYFVHITHTDGVELQPGDCVEFELTENPRTKQPMAVEVKIVEANKDNKNEQETKG